VVDAKTMKKETYLKALHRNSTGREG